MKTFMVVALVLISSLCFAQTSSIDTCNGNISQPNLSEVNKVFSPQGLYLDRKYNWENNVVNCHVNSAIDLQLNIHKIEKSRKTRAIFGQVLLWPSMIIMGIGAASGGAVKGTLVPGLCLGVGGYAIAFGGRKKERKKIEQLNNESQYHISEVKKYYKNQGW
jgi:hypothetical protein